MTSRNQKKRREKQRREIRKTEKKGKAEKLNNRKAQKPRSREAEKRRSQKAINAKLKGQIKVIQNAVRRARRKEQKFKGQR